MQRQLVFVTSLLCAALGVAAPSTAQARSHSHCQRAAHRHLHKHAAPCSGGRSTKNVLRHAPAAGTSTTGATAAACGSESLAPKPGGGAWACSFDDEFDSSTGDPSALNTSWWTPQTTASSGYTTGWPSVACYVNSPNNISVSGGALHLTARKEAQPSTCGYFKTQYTSGMVTTVNSFSQTYGRFEVRAQLPPATVAGLQETLWLWPVNSKRYGSWPGSGEVDFSEFYSQYSSLDVPYIHYNYSSSTTSTATNTNVVAKGCPITLSQYNDYAVTWSPGNFQIAINGTTCLIDNYVPSNVANPAPFDQPFFIALTQALGVGSNALTANTPLPATTSIDYVRAWK